MSFIPGEGTTVPDIDSAIGSGIAITTSPGGADFISTFLTAGGGISIVPSLVNKSVQISGVPGPSGVTVVQSGFGSGIEAVDVSGVVTLTGQYVAGPGLQMVPSGINKTVTIVNTGSVSSLYSQNGSGISITTDVSGTRLAANLTGGTGISVNPSGSNTSQTLVNTGVTSLVGGSGIGVSAATGGITVTNTGVRSLAGQTGTVALTSTGGTVAISSPTPGTINLESTQGGGGTLTAITAGTGIAVTGSAPAPTVSNTGILSLTSGTGIVVGGGQQPSITNSGVTSLVAGAGITLSGATGAVTVSAIPPTPPVLKTWQQVTAGGGTFSTNAYIIFYSWSTSGPSPNPFPTNDPTPIFIQMAFDNIVYQGPFGDPYVAITGGNTGTGLQTPTNTQWLATYQNPPVAQPYTWTYQFMVPPGNLGQQIIISAVSASMSCNCNYTVWMYY